MITGCSTGIGRATAIWLAQRSWPVYATARKLEAIADLTDHGCELLTLDVNSDESMRAAVSAVVSAHGYVYGLVNNAGYSQSGAIEDLPMDSIRRQFETNVFGPIRLAQLVLPGMREQGAGRIINIGSMGGKLTFPGGGIYHATKYSMEAISDALRFEVQGFGVDVALVEPGLIDTNFAQSVTANMQTTQTNGAYDDFNAAVAASTAAVYENPLYRRMGGKPDDVAEVIEKILKAKRPKTRYPVTPSARIIMAQRKIMTDRMWDKFVGTQFPKPGAGSE